MNEVIEPSEIGVLDVHELAGESKASVHFNVGDAAILMQKYSTGCSTDLEVEHRHPGAHKGHHNHGVLSITLVECTL